MNGANDRFDFTSPVPPLEEGLRRTSDWVRDHLDRLEAKSYQI
jgi:hypothetical protein